jgi:S-formylglutathione hydrolase FrmB
VSSLFSQSPVARQYGKVHENQSFQSELLNKAVRYSVYLPPDYDHSRRRYPTVYLLHGLTGSHTDWIQFGEMAHTLDSGIATGQITPMIVVMPDAGNSWYVNRADGYMPYRDMFLRELIPHIDTIYRTRSQKSARGIAGLSMGGYGALHIAMRFSGHFAVCGALSAALHTDDELLSMDKDRYSFLYSDIFAENTSTENRLNKDWRQFNPLVLAASTDKDSLTTVKWYIDCGDDDVLTTGNGQLHLILRNRNIPHEYRVHDGAHTWSYWRRYLEDVLIFMTKQFHH